MPGSGPAEGGSTGKGALQSVLAPPARRVLRPPYNPLFRKMTPSMLLLTGPVSPSTPLTPKPQLES